MKYVKPPTLFQDLMKTIAKERGRLLGLDIGDKYVGLAISDSDNKIASPLSVLSRKKSNMDLMAGDFQRLLSLTGFVVGHPFNRQRSAPDAVQVKLFVDELCKTEKLEGLKYSYWDECFTSKEYLDYVNRKLKLVAQSLKWMQVSIYRSGKERFC